MSLLLVNEGPLWTLGVIVNVDTLSAFLAWWMPLNYFGWLGLILALGSLGGLSLSRRERTIWYQLLMLVAFLPLLGGLILTVLLTIAKELMKMAARRLKTAKNGAKA